MADDTILKMLQQHYEEITYLVEQGDVGQLCGKLSALNGDPAAGQGIILNNPTPQGKLLLHRAVERGDTAIVQTLLDYTCTTRLVRGRYMQPIHYKTDINVIDKTDAGKSVLHHAVIVAKTQKNADMFELLLSRGANPAIRNGYGETSFDIAKKLLEKEKDNPALKKIRDHGIRLGLIDGAEIKRKNIERSAKKNAQGRFKL